MPSLAERYLNMPKETLAITASLGYGKRKFDELQADIRELCRLAKIGEDVEAGRARLVAINGRT